MRTGQCAICRNQIRVGQEIAKTTIGWSHTDCVISRARRDGAGYPSKQQRIVDRTLAKLAAGETLNEAEIAAAVRAARYRYPREPKPGKLMRQAPRPERVSPARAADGDQKQDGDQQDGRPRR
jgi:hypothetical protein